MFFSLKLDEGLELRLLEERHAEAVFAVVDRNRAYLRQWLPWLDVSLSPDDTRNFIKESLGEFANGEGLLAGIWEREQVIGAKSRIPQKLLLAGGGMQLEQKEHHSRRARVESRVHGLRISRIARPHKAGCRRLNGRSLYPFGGVERNFAK